MDDLEKVRFLQHPAARAALEKLWAAGPLTEGDRLGVVSHLRRHHTAGEAAALVEQQLLRQRARDRFQQPQLMLFLPAALEQATSWPLARRRAERLDRAAPPGPFVELGCGLGGDTIELARLRRVVACEGDPARQEAARANLAALGLASQVQFVSAELPDGAAFYADPGRRDGARRKLGPEDWEPPLSTVLLTAARFPAYAVKMAPGVDPDELSGEVEFVSHGRVCKEAVLWGGAATRHQGRTASVHTPQGWISLRSKGKTPPLGPLEPGQYLYEPDPAVIRARALDVLASQLEAHLFDPRIAYLLSARHVPTPLAQVFQVEEVLPARVAPINRRLRELGIGRLEIKKRGFPEDPERFRQRLKLQRGGKPAVLLLSRRDDAHLALLAARPSGQL